jgi:hypothetical protein
MADVETASTLLLSTVALSVLPFIPFSTEDHEANLAEAPAELWWIVL